jgi:hypothetical protein
MIFVTSTPVQIIAIKRVRCKVGITFRLKSGGANNWTLQEQIRRSQMAYRKEERDILKGRHFKMIGGGDERI